MVKCHNQYCHSVAVNNTVMSIMLRALWGRSGEGEGGGEREERGESAYMRTMRPKARWASDGLVRQCVCLTGRRK